MFENLSQIELQQYWWIIVSILGGTLVFLLFVQGGQTLINSLGKTEDSKRLIINSLGRKWEFTFTTLVTFGGALFASFPIFYATSFGGAYWAWTILLLCFVLQAVSYHYRSKQNNIFGRNTYDTFLIINGLIATILIGVVIASFFTGSGFTISENKQIQWDSSLRGIELLFNYKNIVFGLTILSLSRINAYFYLLNSIESKTLELTIISKIKKEYPIFILLLLAFLSWLLLSKGYSIYNKNEIFIEDYKYYHNIIQMPINTIILLIGIILIFIGIYKSIYTPKVKSSIWFSGIGTILTAFALLIIAGFNNTCFYPSTTEIQSSLSIYNASSSSYTLKVMSYVSLIIPFMIAFIWYSWKAINKKDISIEELNSGEHQY